MISKDTILKVESLSKLEFTEEERVKFIDEFQKIIQMVEQLQEIDTEGVIPTYHGNNLINVYREDVPRVNENYQDLLDNAPSVENSFIQVPAIIETEEA